MNYNKHSPPNFYRLEGRTPVPCGDYREWAAALDKLADRRVAATEIAHMTISTVFTGVGLAAVPGEAPELFETKVIGGSIDYEERCSTWEQAEAQHAAAVAFARRWVDDD
jgi:hypothetical protein